MHNFSDQQIGQMAQRATEPAVEVLPAGVGCDLGRQTSQQATKGLCPVARQKELILELVYNPLDDLALARGPTTIRFRPRSAGIVLGSGCHQSSAFDQPAPLPIYRGETLVGQVSAMTISADESIPDGPLVGSRLGQAEGCDHALGGDGEPYLEPVNPLGLRYAPAESGLSGKQSLPARPYPHDRRNQGGVQNVVDLRASRQLPRQVVLQSAHLPLQGAHPPVELALGGECGEIVSQVSLSEPPKIPLAPEAGPLGEDSEGEDLRIGDERWTTGGDSGSDGEVVCCLPPILDENVQ